MKKQTVAVLFGGASSEHEISIITALQAIQAIDSEAYRTIPVYLSHEGKWWTGDALLDKSFYRHFSSSHKQIEEITLLPDPSIQGFVYVSSLNQERKTLPVDLCFLAFHGQFGEDGCVQGLLELADLPYTGSNVTASAIAMHKYHCKKVLEAHKIPVLPSICVTRRQVMRSLKEVCAAIHQTAGLEQFPLFVKPCHLGSSIGISRADDTQTLHAALAKALQYDEKAIIEPCVTDLMEINVAVLDGDPPLASVVEIPLSSGGMLSYEDKYLRGGSKTGERQGMASLTRVIDPVHLDSTIKEEVSQYALKAFSLLGCSGVCRFDFMLNTATGKIYFNELNSIPGSLAFYLWEKSHPPLLYTEMIHRMLQRAQERHSDKLALQRNLGFKALKSS